VRVLEKNLEDINRLALSKGSRDEQRSESSNRNSYLDQEKGFTAPDEGGE